jgi:protein-S-isoprenylcysteine O-methyltransferase Ste14
MKGIIKQIFAILVFLILLAGIYFIAGRIDWIEMHVFISSYILAVIIWVLYLKIKDPELLKERQTAAKKAKKWDRVIISIYVIMLIVFTITAALDAGRYRFSQVPMVLKIISYPVILFCFALGHWAGAANKYLSSYVRIQEERGHYVVKGGPYKYVRHPMYSSFVLSFPFTAFFLGSYLALIPGAMIMILYIIRTYLEDRTLQRELDGYTTYTKQVKYRLIPFVW